MFYQTAASATNSIETIVAQAQSGDKEAFGLIFEMHHRFIYKFIYAMLGNHESAEELTQETFLGAYKNFATLRNESALKTWLCSIAKNTVYKSFRSGKKEGKKSDQELETLDLLDHKNPSPVEQCLSKELNGLIGDALEKLDNDKRLVFVLKEIQQLSYNEIAEITGDAIPKLKTDLFRAKIKMRAMLSPYMEATK